MGDLTVGAFLTTIAAFDASDKDKAKAWIVCDGFDDQIEIQQAIDHWGSVKLTIGTFTFSELQDLSGDEWAI